MKIQLLSDLHLEFEDYPYYDANADIVILAGDINVKKRGLTWARENIKDKPVLYVAGNHEYYGKAYPKLIDEMKALAEGTNVFVLENDMITINGINFFGCTLWSNFELFGDPKIAGYHCQQFMNDYKKIRVSPYYSKLRSIDVSLIHNKSLRWLEQQLIEKQGQKNIIVTHHAPSLQSVPEHKREDMLTAAYASDLEAFIIKYQPKFWLHGHIHRSVDYEIGSCRILSNPKGYPGEENKDFDIKFSFTV